MAEEGIAMRLNRLRRLLPLLSIVLVIGGFIATWKKPLAQQAGGVIGDWPFFRLNRERTGAGTQGSQLMAVQSSAIATTPGPRWVFPHPVTVPSQGNKPLPDNLGNMEASPAVASIRGRARVIFAAFKNYTVGRRISPGNLPAGASPQAGEESITRPFGTVYMFPEDGNPQPTAAGGGRIAQRPREDWWFGYRDIPFEPTDPTTSFQHQFFLLASRRIAESMPEFQPGQDWLDFVPGPIRSSPAVAYLPEDNPLTYTRRWKDASGQGQSDRVSTRVVVIFGSDDGFIYCLDADPENAIRFEWEDPKGAGHITRIAPLVWRYDTRKVLGPNDTASTVQVVSSPLIVDQIPNLGPGPFALIGSGVGRLFVLNVRNGVVARSFKVSPLTKSGNVESGAAFPIVSSPAYAEVSFGPGKKPLVFFGANDSGVYAWDPGRDERPWVFWTGDDSPANDPRNRAGLFNPPVIATPVVTQMKGKDVVIVGATGRKEPDQRPGEGGIGNAGAIYALDAETGTVIWKFTEYKTPRDPEDAPPHKVGEFRASPVVGKIRIVGKGDVTAVIARDELGNVYCLNAEDGSPLWAEPFRLEGENIFQQEIFSSSPILTTFNPATGKNYIFIGSKDGRIRALDPSATAQVTLPDNSKSKDRRPVGDEVWRMQTGVFTISGVDPRTDLPTLSLEPRPILSSPVVNNNYLFVSAGGLFIAFHAQGSFTQFLQGFPYFGEQAPVQEEQPQQRSDQAGAQNRIQVDIFSREDYLNPNLLLDPEHTQSLGGTSQPPNRRWTAVNPGRVEWGDPIYVIAWNLDPFVPDVTLRLQGPNGTYQITVPVQRRPDGTGTTIARYAFYLDPYTRRIVDPRNPRRLIQNPLLDSPLTPGGEGTAVWTVSAIQRRSRPLAGTPSQGATSGQQLEARVIDPNLTNTSSTEDTKARFKINNPIELYLPNGQRLTGTTPDEARRNGNLRVPVYPLVVGDHGTSSNLQVIRVGDRSHLSQIQVFNGNTEFPEGTLPQGGGTAARPPQLRIKFQPAELQWLGGPEAVYKPLFPVYPNGQVAHPSSFVVPPEEVLEEPPAPPGQPNQSLDYPNIPAQRLEFVQPVGNTLRDAIKNDSSLPNATPLGPSSVSFAYRVNIPFYQPANIPPVGIGYATVNPTNPWTREILANPNALYKPIYPTDNIYLARVYVDTNRSDGHDFNEAFRAFITGVQVRIDEEFEIVEKTIEIPGPPAPNVVPPPGVPHGWVPYINYWPQTGGDPTIVQREGVFYRFFTIVNKGNVNLWNLRMDKDPRRVEPLLSDTVDPAPVLSSSRGVIFKGAIDPTNYFSTLDVPPGVSPELPSFWVPARKPRVNAPQPRPMRMVNPFGSNLAPRPHLTVAIPLGTPAGRYVGRPQFFEDGVFVGPGKGVFGMVGVNGVWDTALNVAPGVTVSETTAPRDVLVSVEVMEARLTGFPPVLSPLSTRGQEVPYFALPHMDIAPNGPQIGNAVATAYRDERGKLHLIWSTNRGGEVRGTSFQPFQAPASTTITPWLLAFSTLDFSLDQRAPTPWGWVYQGMANNFFWTPGLEARWWTPPQGPFPRELLKEGFDTFSAPAVVNFKGRWYLFFQGEGSVFTEDQGLIKVGRLFYTRLDAEGQPIGPLRSLRTDQQIPAQQPRPFAYQDTFGSLRLGVIWFGGNPNQWRLFVSTTPDPEDESLWTKPVVLPLPTGVGYAVQPSAFFKGIFQGRSIVEVTFSGYNLATRNPDIYYVRYNANGWNPVPLPRVVNEVLLRDQGRPVYIANGVDWSLESSERPQILWLKPTGDFLQLSGGTFEASTQQIVYRQGDYEVRVDPFAGTVTFLSDDPVGAPLPGKRDLVIADYTPKAWRISTDLRSDTQPIHFIDRSLELIIAPQRLPEKVNPPVAVPRDRLWVIWRRGGSSLGGGFPGEPTTVGTTGSSTLFYKTYRLVVHLGVPIAVGQRGIPEVKVEGNRGPYTIDPARGRVFFTEQDEGNRVNISFTTASGQAVGARAYWVTWQPEQPPGEPQEFPVPMKIKVNEGYVWAFKDPFSYLPPDDPRAPLLGNNNIWLFWTSSRGGNSDIYYMTLSPRL